EVAGLEGPCDRLVEARPPADEERRARGTSDLDAPLGERLVPGTVGDRPPGRDERLDLAARMALAEREEILVLRRRELGDPAEDLFAGPAPEEFRARDAHHPTLASASSAAREAERSGGGSSIKRPELRRGASRVRVSSDAASAAA